MSQAGHSQHRRVISAGGTEGTWFACPGVMYHVTVSGAGALETPLFPAPLYSHQRWAVAPFTSSAMWSDSRRYRWGLEC